MIENLCFEGGGVKGIAFLGAIQCLEKSNLMKNTKNYIGTSCGSITASLLAAGYTTDELFIILYEKDGNFLNIKLGYYRISKFLSYIRNLIKLFTSYGYYNGDEIELFVEQLLEKKLGKKKITFKELYDITGNNLVITGTCLTTQSVLYFNKETYPNMTVSLAVRISSAIPYVFKPVEWSNRIMVDGGILNNFPISYFDNDGITNTKTLGFKFQLENDNVSINNVKDYSIQLIYTILTEMERIQTKDEILYNDRIIEITTKSIPMTKFNLSNKEKKELIETGYSSTFFFLQRKFIGDSITNKIIKP